MAIASHILDRHRPAMIVTADDADQRCRVYSLLGRTRGVPSLIVQQGVADPAYPDWCLSCADAVATMGATSRKVLAKQGVRPERITVTGHPGFDCLLSPELEASVRLRANLGVADGQTMLLFASQPFNVGSFRSREIRRDMIRAICSAAESVENIRLVIKPHPGDNLRELRRLIASRTGIEVVEKEIDISPLIKACDILITFFSTSAIQALYAGKPVINVDFAGSGSPRLFTESKATWTAHSSDEIASHLRRLTGKLRGQEIAIREAARQRFLWEWAHVPDGQAAQRVADLIYDRLGIKKTQ